MSEFCVVVSGQLDMPCNGRIGVAEHINIELGITGKDIFHPVAVHMEGEADISDPVIFRLERDFVGKPVRDCLLQHLHIIGTGVKRIQVFAEIGFPLGAVGIRVNAGAQVVQLHLGAVSDVDAGDPDGGVEQQESHQHGYAHHEETGKDGNIPAVIPQFPADAVDQSFHGFLLFPIMLTDTGAAGYYVDPHKVEVPKAAQLCLPCDRDVERGAQLDGVMHPGGSRCLVGRINGIGDVLCPVYLGAEKKEKFLRFRIDTAGQLDLFYHLVGAVVQFLFRGDNGKQVNDKSQQQYGDKDKNDGTEIVGISPVIAQGLS